MSGYNEFASPLPPGDQTIELEKAKARAVEIIASRIAPAWAAQAIPWSEDEQGKQGFALPGIIPGTYAGIGEGGPKAANWIAGQLGFQTNLPALPGAKAASEMYRNNARWALNTIPNVEAKTEDEQQIANMAFGGASMALPVPGAAFASLPRAAQVIAHVGVPTGIGGGAFGAAATGALGLYEDAQRDKLLTDIGLDPAEMKRIRNGEPPVDLTQPDTSHTVAHPQTGAAATVPFPTSSTTNQPPTDPNAKYETLADFGRPDIKVLTPDFHSTGDTGWTLPKAIGAGVASVATGALLMRYGGKVLDPTIKLVTRKGDQINNAANVAKFNANQAAVDAGRVTGPPAGASDAVVRREAPLPGKAGSVMTNWAQKKYDENRVLTEYVKAIVPNVGPTTGVAKELEAKIGTINNSTPMMNAINEQMATGVNKANGGRQMPSLKGILQDANNLDKAQMDKLNDGLHMSSELNVRDIKFKRAAAAGQPLHGPAGVADDTPFRHNYRDVHSSALRQARADMMADPATASIAQRLYALQGSHAQNMFEMGRITQNAARDMVRDRPWHVPSTDAEGVVTDPLQFTNFNALGWQTPPTRALDAYVGYYAKLHAELRINQLHADLLHNAELYQRANPNAARVVTEILDRNNKPVDAPPSGRTITVYRGGIGHSYNIDNTNLYNAFKGGTAKTNMLLNTADSLRRSYQSGTTGVMASVVGQRPFALINLNRNIPQIAADRIPGTAFGKLDTGLQRMTGGRLGYRGPDPTQYIGSYNEAIKGSAAVTARHMADALRRDGNLVTKALRATKGDAWVDAWASKLENQWATSYAAERKAEGVSGAGSAGVYTRPTYNVTRGRNVDYNPMADVVPGVFHPDGIAIPHTNVRIPGTKGSVSAYINMRSWARDVHQEISDGANSYYWKGQRNNPNISEAQRVYNTRQVIGDPSVQGAGNLAQWATHTIPWINPTIQDAVRMMRNLRDNPVAFTLGTVHTLGVAATTSILSAMLGGNRHLNMLGRLISTHDRASNMTFFHDPDNEHNYTQFSLPQRWRMLYPIILQAVSDGLGVFNLHQDEDAYHRIMHSLSDLYSIHVSHSTAVSSREGLKDFIDPGLPPGVQLAAAAAGKTINSPIGQIIDNVANGQPWNNNIIANHDQRSRLPGQAADSSFVSNDDASWVHQVLKSIYGIAGDGIYNNFIHNGWARWDATHDIATTFGGVVSDAGQTWRDNAPFGNMVWGNNVKMTNRNPIAETNDAAWRVMSDPNYPKPEDITAAGFSRPGGVPISMGGGVKINPDPQIIQMVAVVHNYTNTIKQTIQPRLNDVRAQLKDLDNDPYYNAQYKRDMHNTLTAKQNEIESEKSLMLERLNAQLSHMAGGKHVNVATFKPALGMDQFHD